MTNTPTPSHTPTSTSTFTPSPTPTPILTTLEIRVSQSSDDAEESINGNVNLTSSDLNLVEANSGPQTVGIRFQNVTIPAGADITTAYIQFQVDEATSGNINLTIKGQAADNAPSFSKNSNNISSRPTTSALVSWSPPDWPTIGEAGPDQRTSNIARVIQEIVDRPGWSNGNSLAMIITGTGLRTAEAYDGDVSGAAMLHIEFRDSVPLPTFTPTPTATNT
ncbi:MAG: hypothetical protein R3330_16265, partial [Saprospiraceae bacterium]|nr:hypothetical protein [Saprospiraceae bacterium]